MMQHLSSERLFSATGYAVNKNDLVFQRILKILIVFYCIHDSH